MRVGYLRVGGRLDRYVARLFLLSYLAAFFLVVGLMVIMDMAVQIDEIVQPDEAGNTPSSWAIAQLFALKVPFLYLEMSPYVTLVAGLFTAAKMTRHGEVVAALGAGVSVRRLLAPVLCGASLLAVGMFALRELATREIGTRRDALEDRLKEKRPVQVLENFFVLADTGQRVHLQEYRLGGAGPGAQPAEIRGLSCRFEQGDRQVYLVAGRALPVGAGRWALEDAERLEAGVRTQETTYPELLDDVRFSPTDVELSYRGRERPMGLSFSESRVLLERDPSNAQYRTLFHYHVAFPLAGVVLLLVGLPFVLRQERGKAGERIAAGFFLCVGYFGFEFVTRTLGLQGQLGPLFASWLPVVGFGALGVVLYATQRS